MWSSAARVGDATTLSRCDRRYVKASPASGRPARRFGQRRAAKLDTVNRILPTQARFHYRPSDCGYGIADQSREALMTARRRPPVRTFTRTHLFRGDLLKPRAWREIRR